MLLENRDDKQAEESEQSRHKRLYAVNFVEECACLQCAVDINELNERVLVGLDDADILEAEESDEQTDTGRDCFLEAVRKRPGMYIGSVSRKGLEAAMKEQARLREIPRELAVYEITGPLFFGAADRINQIETREETKCLVLRMRAVPAVDSTAMNSMVALYERCQKNGVTLILSHVNEQPMHVMEKAGFVDMIGRAHFCPNIEAALDHADEVLGK